MVEVSLTDMCKAFIAQLEGAMYIIISRIAPAILKTDTHREAKFLEKYCKPILEKEGVDILIKGSAANKIGYEFQNNIEYVGRGIFNSFVIYLHHLLEIQVNDYWRHKYDIGYGISIKNKHGKELYDFIKTEIPEIYDIYMKIKSLSDCIKHGEGRSCDELRQMTDSYFTSYQTGIPALEISVGNTLVGLYIRVSDEQLWELFEEAIAQWSNHYSSRNLNSK